MSQCYMLYKNVGRPYSHEVYSHAAEYSVTVTTSAVIYIAMGELTVHARLPCNSIHRCRTLSLVLHVSVIQQEISILYLPYYTELC